MFGLFGGDPLRDAKKILGVKNVITPRQMKKALAVSKAPSCHFCYSNDVLAWCSEENKKGELWRLFPRVELSIASTRSKHPTEFSPASIWLNPPSWLLVSPNSEYRLINFNIKPIGFGDSELNAINSDRAWVVTLVQALIAFKRVHGTIFLENGVHIADPEGDLVPLVGSYDKSGILIYTLSNHCYHGFSCDTQLGTVVCKVPDVVKKK